ncbi:hypothetical protein EPN96_04280 [bacterium]|nr:MAG: hypothetical protein EPN96_04280 [bacterium]
MDKRQFSRANVAFPAKLLEIGAEDDPVRIEVHQLGEGGCLLKGDEFLGVGRVFSIDLNVSGNYLKPIGRVLYEYRGKNSEIFSGVEFYGLEEEATKTVPGISKYFESK